MAYLLKLTVIWTLLLILFEVFYKGSNRFTLNRFFLILSVIAGILLPLISLPSSASVAVYNTRALYAPVLNSVPAAAISATTSVATSGIVTTGLDILSVMLVIYLVGVAFLCLRALRELVSMLRLIQRASFQTIDGHKVIITGKVHAPYSFFSLIFIGHTNTYKTSELDFILLHEAAHSNKKHWADLLLMQLFCIAFWFHPLIWRYRYLLQLQHEYEADQIAAQLDAYAYGHFLLQQTMLGGVPQIAHSFHFSPIKNRISMLTKNQNRKRSPWKYLLFIPTLLICTVLMANPTWRSNVTVFKGNTFAWRETDTMYYNAEKHRPEIAAKTRDRRQIIYSMNNQPVYLNEYLKTPATFSGKEEDYIDYLKETFHALCKHTPDSLAGISVVSIVVDKKGKVVNYDVRYFNPLSHTYKDNRHDWDPLFDIQPKLNSIMDKVITEGPAWKPAYKNGKPVNSVVSFANIGC